MRDVADSLNALAKEVHENAAAHGFWEKDRNMGEMLMLAVSELAEALEEDRDGTPDLYYDFEHNQKPEGLAVEVVDCIIRCLDLLYSRGVDIDRIMAEKMAYNASRPHKHGRAY